MNIVGIEGGGFSVSSRQPSNNVVQVLSKLSAMASDVSQQINFQEIDATEQSVAIEIPRSSGERNGIPDALIRAEASAETHELANLISNATHVAARNIIEMMKKGELHQHVMHARHLREHTDLHAAIERLVQDFVDKFDEMMNFAELEKEVAKVQQQVAA